MIVCELIKLIKMKIIIYKRSFCFVFQLLDACINNCGRNFHLEVASREFETEFRKLLTKSQPKISEILRGLLKKWAEGYFKTDPQLSLIPSLYNKLRQEGVDFSQVDGPKVNN